MTLLFRYFILTVTLTMGLANTAPLAYAGWSSAENLSPSITTIQFQFNRLSTGQSYRNSQTEHLTEICHHNHSSDTTCSGFCLLTNVEIRFVPYGDLWSQRTHNYYTSCVLTGLKRPPKLIFLFILV